MINDTLFDEIQHLHSQCSIMDKTTKLGYLMGLRNRLNQMAFQFTEYLKGRIGITQKEKELADQLVEMINTVEIEGRQTQQSIVNECLKELAKMPMR